MINLPITGLSNDTTHISYISNNRESDLTKYLHENESNRKSYPQRNNRSKLNYRDLERGMYEEIRQSMWTLGGRTLINKNSERSYHNGEHEIIDLSMDDDDDDNEKSSNDTDQTYRRLWCICQRPWDHSKLTLRCDSCANWYHGDCIGVSAEDAKTLEINDEQFICPTCQGTSRSTMKQAKSSEELIASKQKRSDEPSPIQENEISSRSISPIELMEQSKPSIILKRVVVPADIKELPTYCIVHDCINWAKHDWVYCSLTCIRRHINDTLQDIQRSKGMSDVDIPTSDDILLYDSKTKTIVPKNLVPKIEDLRTWINQHPSYQITKRFQRKSSPKSTHRPKFPSATKSKTSLTSVASNKKLNAKSIPNKNDLIPLGKSTNKTTSNTNNMADIRTKVPTALYDKIIMRFKKSGEKHLKEHEIRIRLRQIEQEMFRVHGKVDNSYKNKFRSLLANISNMNNNFFYKEILSKDLTAQQIVAMKPQDMLPPEEKEKHKDEFNKEVQMIIEFEEEKAAEMERRRRTKLTRQGLVDNDAHYSSVYNMKEKTPSEEEFEQRKLTMKSTETNSIATIESNNQTKGLLPTSVTKKIDSNETSKVPIVEETNPTTSTVDLDNDYIEPESPTGVDALIYDEEENDDDPSHVNTSPRPSTSHSLAETAEETLPSQQIIRDDYNPLKARNETSLRSPSAPIVRLPNQSRGTIHFPDIKFPYQSVHNYGESDYLISHIPVHLVIVGRLRLEAVWSYVRDSLVVRDVLILTLTSSSLNTKDNERFVQYVDTMHRSGRAAVIDKCTNSSVIRDMYILTADTKKCPTSVLSSLFLPTRFESKQFFLVIIGSEKRTMKAVNGLNENQISNNLTYKPVALQNSSITQDPRLLKNKDPRLNRSQNRDENISLPTLQLNHAKQTTVQYSNDGLLKLISDSLQRLRHASTADTVGLIVASTMDVLKANKRDDLVTRFINNLRVVMTEWQTVHGNTSISIPAVAVGDNLIEENMDVDDDQDDKQKKQITTSSSSSRLASKFKDIDYRFLDQDMDHQKTKTNQITNHHKQRRKSRFSDISPDRAKKFKSNNSTEKFFPKTREDRSALGDTSLRLTNTKIASLELSDKQINSSLNTKDNFISNTNNKDIYERSSKVLTNSIQRSTTTLNLITQSEIKNRFSSNTNEWKSRSSNSYYMTHYHDFDQPEE